MSEQNKEREAFAVVRAQALNEALKICESEYRIRDEAGRMHPEDSPSRDRCFAAARAAWNCAKEIQALIATQDHSGAATQAEAQQSDVVTREQVAEWGKLAGIPHAALLSDVLLAKLSDFAVFARSDLSARLPAPAPSNRGEEADSEPDALGYATRLAESLWRQYYQSDAPNWKPLETVSGVLTQIDNMVSGMTRKVSQSAEPVALTREDQKRIAWDVQVKCSLIPGASFYNAADMAIDAWKAAGANAETKRVTDCSTEACQCDDCAIGRGEWAPVNDDITPAPSNRGEEAESDIPDAIRLLGLMFDGYENGVQCNEDGDGAYIGQAFRLSDEDFHAIATLLNRHETPRFDVRTDGVVVPASQSASPAALTDEKPYPFKRYEAMEEAGRQASAEMCRLEQYLAQGTQFNPKIDDPAFLEAWPEIQKAGYDYGWLGIGLAAWRAAMSREQSQGGE